MFYIVFTIHIVLCVSLVGLVLLQQGKGADMGAAFGGGSNTLFGATGATAFITKLTTWIAIAFMATSIVLVNIYSSYARSGLGGVDSGLKVVESMMKPTAAPQAPVAEKKEEAPAAAAVVVPPQNNASAPVAPVNNAPVQNAPVEAGK